MLKGLIKEYWQFVVIFGLLIVAVGAMKSCTSAERDATISHQNELAANDKTRKIELGKDSLVGAYVRLQLQRNVDVKAFNTQLAELTHQVKVVQHVVGQLTLTAKPDSGHTTSTIDQHGTRTALTTLDGTNGIEGSIVAVAPALITNPMTLDHKLKVSPIILTYGIGCTKSGPLTSIVGPNWLQTQIAPGQVDPNLCNPKRAFVNLKLDGKVAFGAGAVTTAITAILGHKLKIW